jgi:hypothetical protein
MQIGQKVEFIGRGEWGWFLSKFGPRECPKYGDIYTVRDMWQGRSSEGDIRHAIALVEILGPRNEAGEEVGWDASEFRPINRAKARELETA